MSITFLDIFLLGLATFRLTRLLVYDKITAFIRNMFITEVEDIEENGDKAIYLLPKEGRIRGFFGELLSCYWCTGVWSSLLLYGLYVFWPVVAVPMIIILAISGIAAIIESIIQIWL
ncbi:DUF1360 domain-containing protein [Niallia sp. Krafla_26]|uniref:DUF1360 domain-containing protein n=1 Tax=Niallia sp. Krafla_26 TaxID=3064703 RepID=UPI003D18534A